MAKMTTEQLALNTWSRWGSEDGTHSHTEIQSACLAYMSQQARIQSNRLRNIDNSMGAIKHYFHSLDRDGFRELIRAKASDTRRRHNRKIINMIGCSYCNVPMHTPCENSNGVRKPHIQRVRAYESGA